MLYQIWTSLTEAQATIVNGGLTVFAAGFGVLLGWYLFGGKVKNITDAIETSKHLVDDHLGRMDEALAKINRKADDLDQVLAVVTERLSRTASAEAADAEEEGDVQEAENGNSGALDSEPSKSGIHSAWRDIANHLGTIANNPAIDGRRRAKYFRIDRRSFGDLIAALAQDDNISSSVAAAAKDAYTLKNSFRRRRADPTLEEYNRMLALRNTVLAAQPKEPQD